VVDAHHSELELDTIIWLWIIWIINSYILE
jgi:hypothetical protein